MKVYFAGSIRGGRQDAALYSQIIELLRSHGDVLTEHVGEMDPDRAEDNVPDEVIYRRDMAWLEEVDALVAEVTVPSHGVGYEIARAVALGKPTLCIHRPEDGGRLSALIAGNPMLRCECYQRVEELNIILASFLRSPGLHTRKRG
jgi:nucleoside 2-deoxyribosyltransferase